MTKKMLYLSIFYIIILGIIWLSPFFRYKTNDKIIYPNIEKMDVIALNYATRDIKNHFERIIFLQFYEDIIYLVNSKKINIVENEPIISVLDDNKFSKTIKKLENLKDTVRKFNHSECLKEIYIYPINGKKYMYKINPQTLQVYFIKLDTIQKFNNNPNFLRFDFNLRSMYFVKKDILDAYKKELNKILDLADDINNQVSKDVNQYINEVLYITKWILSLLGGIGLLLVWIYIRKIQKENKDILSSIKKFEKEQKQYTHEKHYSQHDIKTNSQMILNQMFYLYSLIKDNEKAIEIVSELNMLEYTILQANSYSKDIETSINQYNFKENFVKENFYNLFIKHKIEKPLISKGKELLFDYNINLENMDKEHVINVKEDDNLYNNELSMVLFKLLNNAIKHRKPDTKISVDIGLDKNNRLLIKIINFVVDDEKCENIKNKILKVVKDKNLHNMSVITNILEKYNYTINIKCLDNNRLEISVKEKD